MTDAPRPADLPLVQALARIADAIARRQAAAAEVDRPPAEPKPSRRRRAA